MVDEDDIHPAKAAREMEDKELTHKVDMVVNDRLSSTYFVKLLGTHTLMKYSVILHSFSCAGSCVFHFCLGNIHQNGISSLFSDFDRL